MKFLDDLGQYGKYDSEFDAVAPFNSQQCAELRNLSCMLRGSTKETRGTAYVVYEDIYDAKTAVEHLSGFNVANRYLIVLYYNHQKHSKKVSLGAMIQHQFSPGVLFSQRHGADLGLVFLFSMITILLTVETNASTVSDVDMFAAEY